MSRENPNPNPGPLHVVPPELTAGWGWCVADENSILLSMRGAKVPAAQKRADAALFAAAPDLLAAAVALDTFFDFGEVLEAGDYGIEKPAGVNAAFAAMRAAVAKATGGQS